MLAFCFVQLLPNFLDLLASVGFGTRSSTLPRDTSKKTGFQKHLPILKRYSRSLSPDA